MQLERDDIPSDIYSCRSNSINKIDKHKVVSIWYTEIFFTNVGLYLLNYWLTIYHHMYIIYTNT